MIGNYSGSWGNRIVYPNVVENEHRFPRPITTTIVPRTRTTVTVPKAVVPTTVAPRSSSTTSTTVPRSTTTSTTIPRTTTTTLPRATTTTIVRPKSRVTPLTPGNITVIANKTPIIIGDSIAVGLSNRYDVLNPGIKTGELDPNPHVTIPYSPPSQTSYKWDGVFQKIGENNIRVYLRLIAAMSYQSGIRQAANRIVWLSTGASNNIAAGIKDADTMGRVHRMLVELQTYNSHTYVIGVSNELDQKHPINNQIKEACSKYKNTFFVGGFDAPGDGIHPPNYNAIVNSLIKLIPSSTTIVIPPTTTIPPTTITIPSTTTTVVSQPVDYFRPDNPQYKRLPPTTTTTTTAPNGSTTTTTVAPTTSTTPPSSSGTMTTTTAPNGTTTTTTVKPRVEPGGGYPGLHATTTTTVVATPPTVTTTITIPSTTTTVPTRTAPVVPRKPRYITDPDNPDNPNYKPPYVPPLTVPAPVLLSYDIISMTSESDPDRVNIDVSIYLKFSLDIIKGKGIITFYKKNTRRALARINMSSSEISFPDTKTIIIIPKNVLPYDTEVSIFIGPGAVKSVQGKDWAGISNYNAITFTTVKKASIQPVTPITPVIPVVPPAKGGGATVPGTGGSGTGTKPINPAKPVIPKLPEIDPPNNTIINPGKGNIIIGDPITRQSNDGLWERGEFFVGTKIITLKQDVKIVDFAPHTSWVFQFDILDDANIIQNIGRIGIQTNAAKCKGEQESPFVCFFSMYGGVKALPDTAVDRFRQPPCINEVSDYGPGLSLRNRMACRPKDLFDFKISLSLIQSQEYTVTFLCTSSSRPSDVAFGSTIYETDTDKIYMWNSLVWFLIANATLNISMGAVFSNPNTFIIDGIWWSGMVWNRTLRRTYPLGNIFVPYNYTNIDATRNFVRYFGSEADKTNVSERKASSNFIAPIGFSLDGIRGVYKAK